MFKAKAQDITPQKIDEVIDNSLGFLVKSQVKETVGLQQFAGEWPSYMNMTNPFFLLGKSKKYRDSNCFAITGIFNALAESYKYDSTNLVIKTMLKSAYPELLTYKNSNGFNFWKSLPANQRLSLKEKKGEVYYVRRPTHFKLKGRFINNAANITNDADDTSMGNLAIYYYSKIFNDTILKPVTFSVFDQYRDINRKNYHWHNYLVRIPRRSGAYLTWLDTEDSFNNWNFAKAAANNLVFFIPKTSTFPTPYKPYLPWGANDLDAVVNCNVLIYLAYSKQLTMAKGAKNSNEFIDYQIKRGRWSRAGLYYPNRFNFHYAVTRSIIAGNTDQQSNTTILADYLIKSQKPDGHFNSRQKVNKKDKLQSTVYGFMSMLNLCESGEKIPKILIDRSLNYILEHQNPDGSWNGGVFFSGGTVVRNVLIFQSESYTTALMILALNKYKNLYFKQKG